MSDRRDLKPIDPERGACATVRQQVAAKLDQAERSPVVLSSAERTVIRHALRSFVVGPKAQSHTERVVARELLDRKFKDE